MKFNPLSGKLSTDDGKYLKKLSCPMNASHHDLVNKYNITSCNFCKEDIVNISDLSDDKLRTLFEKFPNQCVSLSLDSSNLRVVHDD